MLYYRRMLPLPQTDAIKLLLELGRVSLDQLVQLERCLERNRHLPQSMSNLLDLIWFVQEPGLTPTLH